MPSLPSSPPLEHRDAEGRRRRRRFRQPAPSPDTPRHGKAPASCQAGDSPLVLQCRGGHLLRALGWHSRALS